MAASWDDAARAFRGSMSDPELVERLLSDRELIERPNPFIRPPEPRPSLLCRLGLHRYVVHMQVLYGVIDTGRRRTRCVRCGKVRHGRHD